MSIGTPPCRSWPGVTAYIGDKAPENVMSLTGTLMLVGLLLAVLALVFLILGIFWPQIGVAALICGLVGSILVPVAPLYMFAAFPGAIKNFATLLTIDVSG